GSRWLHTRVRVGDTLDVAAPRGSFTLRDGETPVLLLSAGIGVTPVLAMLHVLAAARTTRPVWWLHGARDGAEHALAREVRTWPGGLPNGHWYVCYSRPGAADRAGRDYDTAGRLSAELFALICLPRDGDAYLCGPTAFMQELTAALAAWGLDRSRIRTEIY